MSADGFRFSFMGGISLDNPPAVVVSPTMPTGPLVPKAHQNPEPVPGGLFDANRTQRDDAAQPALLQEG